MSDLQKLAEWHNRRAKWWGQYACEGHKDAVEHQAAHVETARILDLLGRVRSECDVRIEKPWDANEIQRVTVQGPPDLLRHFAKRLGRG